MSKEEAIKLLFLNTMICAQIRALKKWEKAIKIFLKSLKIGVLRVKYPSGIRTTVYRQFVSINIQVGL